MSRRRKKGCVEALFDDCCDIAGGLTRAAGYTIGGVIGAIGAAMPYGEEDDTHVEYGSDFWGHKYKKTNGICYRCHGTGSVHGKICRKCDGSGKFSRTTWYD